MFGSQPAEQKTDNMVEAKQDEKALAKQAQANTMESAGILIKKGTQQQNATKSPEAKKGMARVRRRAARRGMAKEEESNINSISEDWTLCLHDDSPNLMLNDLQHNDDQILGNRTVSNDDCATIQQTSDRQWQDVRGGANRQQIENTNQITLQEDVQL